jgi:hypothetical protein
MVETEQHIRQWLNEHKSFMNLLDGFAFDIVKNVGTPCEKVDVQLVEGLLENEGLETDFTAHELVQVWRKI